MASALACWKLLVPALEGLSLQPLLENARAKRRPALITYLRGNHAVRTEKWRYIVYRDGSEELYDCEADPMEYTNLANRPLMDKVKEELARWLPRTNAEDKPLREEFDFDYATHTYRYRGK